MRPVKIGLLTNYLAPYRVPLYERLAARHDLEVLLYGGGERYIPPWFADLDEQIAAAGFPAKRLAHPREAFAAARHHDVLIAPFAGGSALPLAYLGARARRKHFILWASVWAQPRSLAHAVALPLTRRIYRDADAVIAYGPHVRRFVTSIRGRDEDVFVAPQSVEPELFGREVGDDEVTDVRARHDLGDGPLVLYSGRLVAEKGVGLLLDVWEAQRPPATLVLAGDGPLRERAASTPGARLLGAIPRRQLPPLYAAAVFSVLASLPTPRFREPWGLVCNESMHQGTPVIASDAVGAAAGGLVRDGETGIVVPAGDGHQLARAIEALLHDEPLRRRLGQAARDAVAGYCYEAMVAAFERALDAAVTRRR